MNRGIAVLFSGSLVFSLWSFLQFQNASNELAGAKANASQSFDLLDEAKIVKADALSVLLTDADDANSIFAKEGGWELVPIQGEKAVEEESELDFAYFQFRNPGASLFSLDQLLSHLQQADSPCFSLVGVSLQGGRFQSRNGSTTTSIDASNAPETWDCQVEVRCLVPRK